MSKILKPSEVRHWIKHYIDEWDKMTDPPTISDGRRGAIRGSMNRCLGNMSDDTKTAEEKRHIVTGWLFAHDFESPAPMSSKDLTGAQWFALRRWEGAERDPATQKYFSRPTFEAEIKWVYNWAQYDLERLETNPDLIMSDLLEFWRDHGYDINQGDDIAQAALSVGGVPTQTTTITISRWVSLPDEQRPEVYLMDQKVESINRDYGIPDDEPIQYVVWLEDGSGHPEYSASALLELFEPIENDNEPPQNQTIEKTPAVANQEMPDW